MLAAWIPQGPGPSTNGQVENVADVSGGPFRDEVVGAIHTVLAHPTNADILYAGGTNGGIWRTDNATAANPNWTPLIDAQSSLSIGAMAFDVADATGQTIIAANGRFSSFGNVGGPLDGLLFSDDGGASFTRITDPLLTDRNFSGVAKNGDLILAGANAFGSGVGPGLYRSTDNGATWNLVPTSSGLDSGAALDLVSDPTDVDRYYVSIEDTGIFRSDDGGATWANVSVNDATLDTAITAASNNNTEMAVGNGGRIYAAVLQNGQAVFIGFSDDQGASWTEMDLPRTLEGNGDTEGLNPTVKPGGQGAIHFSIVVDPNSDTTVYVAGDRQDSPFPNFIGANDFSGRLFRGDTTVAPTGAVPSPQWEHLTHSDSIAAIPGGGTANTSAPHADSREMTFDANGNLIETDDGGIYRRTSPQDNTGDWFSIIGDIQTTEIHDVAYDTLSNIIISGNQDTGTTQQTAAGSFEWFSVSTADGGDVGVSPDPTNPARSVRYSSFQNLGGFTRRTYNNTGGLVNTVGVGLAGFLAADRQFVTPFEINAANPNRLVIGGAIRLYESLDQGDNVTSLGGISVNSFNGDPLAYGGFMGGVANEDVLYVGSGSNVFVRTTGAGAPAIAPAYATAGGGQVRDIVLHSDDWMTAFVVDTDEVFMTTDAGVTWTDISGNIATLGSDFHAVEFIATTSGGIIAVGGATGVFSASLTDTSTWTLIGTDLPNVQVWDLDYDPDDDVLIAGTLGRGAWRYDNVSVGGVPQDFGDAPDTYFTLRASGGPQHTATGATLGADRDNEGDGQPTAAADGDDVDNIDDEDGVTFSLLVIDELATITFEVAGSTANTRVDAFIDYDSSGTFDAGERITPLTGLVVVDGPNMFVFTVPDTATAGDTYARVRISETGGLDPTGPVDDGEVEDYAVTLLALDYGDAPDSYTTLQASDGPRHADTGPTLGATRDTEADGIPTTAADGDDNDNSDDEDGLVSRTRIEPGLGANIVVEVNNAGGGAFVDAFIDYNRDGDFDVGERITPAAGQPVSNGNNTINFTAPANATLGNNFLRIRVSTAGGLGPGGHADDGEVEDHAVLIERPFIVTGPDVGDSPAVKLFDASSGVQLARFFAFEQGFLGGVRVATGDVNGDGAPEIIAGKGPGERSEVRVFDGNTLRRLPGMFGSFNAFDAGFRGGVMVASGDVNGDGFSDVIVGPDNGYDQESRPNTVRVFSGVDGSLLSEFAPFSGNANRTGYRVAAADFTGDGQDDVIVGMGGGTIVTRVKSFDMTNLANPAPIASFRAFGRNYTAGVYVGAGDVDGDGAADYILGQGRGAKNRLKALSGVGFAQLANFRAFNALSDGVRVSVTEFDDLTSPEILAGSGPGADTVRVIRASGGILAEFDGGYSRHGVFVAGTADAGEAASPIVMPPTSRGNTAAGGRDDASAPTVNDDDYAQLALAVQMSAHNSDGPKVRETTQAAFAQEFFWNGI